MKAFERDPSTSAQNPCRFSKIHSEKIKFIREQKGVGVYLYLSNVKERQGGFPKPYLGAREGGRGRRLRGLTLLAL